MRVPEMSSLHVTSVAPDARIQFRQAVKDARDHGPFECLYTVPKCIVRAVNHLYPFSGSKPERVLNRTFYMCGRSQAIKQHRSTIIQVVQIERARFAADSPLEGTGFEPSVPRK